MLENLRRFSGTLQVGSTGAPVADWQEFLRSQGYPKVTGDGSYGQVTRSATTAFQQKHGLVADGIVGRQTLQAALIVLGYASPSSQVGPGRIGTTADSAPVTDKVAQASTVLAERAGSLGIPVLLAIVAGWWFLGRKVRR